MNTAAPRIAALFTAAALGLTLLAGCSNENVSCGLDQCTVTIDRTVNASASVLGVEAKFVSADENTVTVEVAGLLVSLDSITADNIGIQVSR